MVSRLSLAILFYLMMSVAAHADEILVADDNFNKFVEGAKPGDVFAVYPGIYRLTKTVLLQESGTEDQPITIRPSTEGEITIEVPSTIGFKIIGSNWHIEGIKFVGVCESDSKCEHAFQVLGTADGTVIRNNKFIDFNAAIKGNGQIIDEKQYFPDNVLIEDNYFYNRRPRNTSNPVTPIDVVGGRFWTIRHNFFADFQKAGGNYISYAAFLKGNSDNGIFERNLIICEWRHHGGVRLGLSLGGGGTSDPRFCQGRSCKIEHYKGLISSNIIMNCPADVGIYLNNAANTKIINNTILNTAGVDVRFSGSFALFANNIIEGRIKGRDNGRFREVNNIVENNLDDFFPGADAFDLAPLEPEELMRAAQGYAGKDFCTGKTQEKWVGAIAEPAQCRIEQFLQNIERDEQTLTRMD
ncbi:chondroitinase-B domain-containing protein [Kordiimonas aestuarii]|uniref:chondroitinase-B domain-containing protein n=1 Tax=Kordiimonas aestuarii TaxID=1005925 RepID=UPI0021CF7513|nr:chondroitinase-B domain-containing protein [Kordiimonas aestuarii]